MYLLEVWVLYTTLWHARINGPNPKVAIYWNVLACDLNTIYEGLGRSPKTIIV